MVLSECMTMSNQELVEKPEILQNHLIGCGTYTASDAQEYWFRTVFDTGPKGSSPKLCAYMHKS